MNDALRSFIDVEAIDMVLANEQHIAYRDMLTRAGANVVVLNTNSDCADAVFVEDTAIVVDELVVILNLAAPSRRDEPRGIEPELRRHRDRFAHIEAPATIDGGDVLRVGRTLFVGASARTNAAGIAALAAVTKPFGYDVRAVRIHGCLHLKTACTALPDGRLLLNPAWIDLRDLEGMSIVEVPAAEPDGANMALVGERVLMGATHPASIALVKQLGFDVDSVNLSEFAKAEGCVTCLSILV